MPLTQTIDQKLAKLNGPKFGYVSQIIQLNISHLLAHSYISKRFYFKLFNFA